MKSIIAKYRVRFWWLPIFMLLAFSGCLKSDLSNCPNLGEIVVVVEAVNIKGEHVPDEVDNVVLYLFCTETGFVKKIHTELGVSNTIENLDKGEHTFVAWGNAKNEGMILSPEGENKKKKDFHITTHTVTVRTDNGYLCTPMSDLFWEKKRFSASTQAGQSKITVKMQRVVGSATVKVLGLDGAMKEDDIKVTFSDAHNTMNFSGECFGKKVVYKPTGYFNNEHEYTVDKFIMPAVDQPIRVNVHHGDQLLHSATELDDGTPLIVEKEQVLNIIIDFSSGEAGEITVTGELQPWDEKVIEKE